MSPWARPMKPKKPPKPKEAKKPKETKEPKVSKGTKESKETKEVDLYPRRRGPKGQGFGLHGRLLNTVQIAYGAVFLFLI